MADNNKRKIELTQRNKIEVTQQVEMKSKKKSKTIKTLLVSLGTLTLAAGAAYGLVVTIEAAKADKI